MGYRTPNEVEREFLDFEGSLKHKQALSEKHPAVQFSRNPVSFAVVRGSAHHRESSAPLGLPFSDGAFVARTAPSGTTPDTRQPAPRLHHFRT